MSGGAVIVMRQNRYIRTFRQAGADAPQTARRLDDLRLRDSWIFRRMAAWGVFVSADSDRWYMDEAATVAWLGRRAKIMFRMTIGALVFFALVMIWLSSQ